MQSYFAFRFSNFFAHFIKHINDGHNGLMSKLKSFHDLFFSHFIRATLNHQNRITGCCNTQVEIRNFHLCIGRIHDEFTIDQT